MIGVSPSIFRMSNRILVRFRQYLASRRYDLAFRVRGAMFCWVPFSLLLTPTLGQETLNRYEFSMPSMGTQLDFIVYASSKDAAALAIDTSVFVLEQESIPINNYTIDSEVSKLGNSKVGEFRSLSPILGKVLGESLQWHEASVGAFDVTAGTLTQLWRGARKKKALPSSQELRLALENSGWSNVRFEKNLETGALRSVSFLKSGMFIDVGGIATGYLLDRMMETLREKGIQHALINAGGDILVSQPPPGKPGWTIDIAGISKSSPPLFRLELVDAAVTTSGDLYQFAEIDGRRYSHLISPTTGVPVEVRQSVTVVAKRAIDADAGATALAVLGPVEAYSRFSLLPIEQAVFLTLESEDQPPSMRTLGRTPERPISRSVR